MFHIILHFGQKHCGRKWIIKLIGWMMRILYQCDIPLTKTIDKTVWFCHNGFGTVINPNTVICKGVMIQHGVTIGELDETHLSPYIDENVFIGARAMILGNIKIGKNAKIGAGAVVLQDVPENCTAVGVPAKIIYKNGNEKLEGFF